MAKLIRAYTSKIEQCIYRSSVSYILIKNLYSERERVKVRKSVKERRERGLGGEERERVGLLMLPPTIIIMTEKSGEYKT